MPFRARGLCGLLLSLKYRGICGVEFPSFQAPLTTSGCRQTRGLRRIPAILAEVLCSESDWVAVAADAHIFRECVCLN